jgi:hypothetical protein
MVSPDNVLDVLPDDPALPASKILLGRSFGGEETSAHHPGDLPAATGDHASSRSPREQKEPHGRDMVRHARGDQPRLHPERREQVLVLGRYTPVAIDVVGQTGDLGLHLKLGQILSHSSISSSVA